MRTGTTTSPASRAGPGPSWRSRPLRAGRPISATRRPRGSRSVPAWPARPARSTW